MTYIKYKILLVLLIITNVFYAQVLTKQEAAKITLENNFGIKIAKNNLEIAKNNTSKYNTGELPTVFLNSGINYGLKASDINYHSDKFPSTSFFGANSATYNGSIVINYTLFDWKKISYTKERLKESLNIADLELRQSMENSLIQLFSAYYGIANLQELLYVQNEIMQISKQRLRRAKLRNEYGKSNKLQILNAEVDLNRDSVNILNFQQQLTNAKRNLNLIMGRDLESDFDIDTLVLFDDFSLDELIAGIDNKNTDLLIMDKNVSLSELSIKMNKARLKPTISAVGNYGLSGGFNDTNYSIKNQFGTGLTAGLSLSWNIFDGGATKVRNQNALKQIDNLQVQKELIRQQIISEMRNYYQTYQTQKYVMQVELENIKTSKINFKRTHDLFNIGRVTSVEFRQAQLNLFNSLLNYKKAKYNAKTAELNILQLSGNILDVIK